MEVTSAVSVLESPPACPELLGVISQAVTDADFALFQRVIEREAGIYLSSAKKSLLAGRLSRRLRELNLPTLQSYYRRVIADPQEQVRMIDCISTNETQFFREPHHFEFLESQVFPRWTSEAIAGARQKHIRVWSAGCSTGEEPYSLAMTLLHHFPPLNGWRIEVLATDISTRVLERAHARIWPAEKARQIPAAYLKAFMLRGTGTQEGKIKAGDEIRKVVRFERFNLLGDSTGLSSAPFDLILCRNVLIYFRPETKAQVIRGLLRSLAADGYLFVGHSESLNQLADCLHSVVPTVYVRSENSVKTFRKHESELKHG